MICNVRIFGTSMLRKELDVLAAIGIKILASRSSETMELIYIAVHVVHYHSPCLQREYICPCRTLVLSLSNAQICLSLSHTIALLVYGACMSILVAR